MFFSRSSCLHMSPNSSLNILPRGCYQGREKKLHPLNVFLLLIWCFPECNQRTKKYQNTKLFTSVNGSQVLWMPLNPLPHRREVKKGNKEKNLFFSFITHKTLCKTGLFSMKQAFFPLLLLLLNLTFSEVIFQCER